MEKEYGSKKMEQSEITNIKNVIFTEQYLSNVKTVQFLEKGKNKRILIIENKRYVTK